MTRDEAAELLASTASRDRRRGAQFFVTDAEVGDIPLLRRARQTESDSYALRRLDLALSKFVASEYAAETDVNDDLSLADNALHAQAVEWVGRLILHEMEGPIGRVALYASMEIQRYEESKTKLEIEGLKLIFAGLTTLIEASRSPSRTDFDLAGMVDEIVLSEVGSKIQVSSQGAKPFVVTSDPSLLRLAFTNGLRNAVEAILEIGASVADHPIVLAWGQSDREIWLSVIDAGPGVKGAIEDRFKAGSTSKNGHLGFGLAVARRAMESLGGTVELKSPPQGGASYELRWSVN